MKLGRLRPVHRTKLKLAKYMPDLSTLPTPPESCDFSVKAPAEIANVYLNDKYGDCVIAGGYHLLGVWAGFTATDDQILADYETIGGFDPNRPAETDNGCNETEALQYWIASGFADGSKLAGYVGVDATNKAEVQVAIFLFDGLMLGIELPDEWPITTGVTWDMAGAANPKRGHCGVVIGYNASGVQVATWGGINTITWDAFAYYCSSTSGGEAYALLNPEMVTPNGFDLASLQADLAALSS